MTPRYNLIFAQKTQIFNEYKRRQATGGDDSQQALANWAQKSFSLAKPPHQATISRAIARLSNNPVPVRQFIHKRDRQGKNHFLEEALFAWTCEQYRLRKCVNLISLRIKAQKIQESVNKKLPADNQFNMKFSTGWCSRFQKRWGLKSRPTVGEAGDADTSEIEKQLPNLRKALQVFQLKDIWNADEFGLFYSMAPSKTISRHQLAGRKKQKARITVLACCNADESEKFPLFFIGKAKRPHCFGRKTGAELGFNYAYNTKAWMRAPLFYEWLENLDKYISKPPGRQILLLVDNCSAHGNLDTIPKLQHVKVLFLPPNTTSHIQPLDAGIIASVKMQYRRWQVEHALDMQECDLDNIYKVDQLRGMSNVSVDTIKNCWNHTGLLDGRFGDSGECVQSCTDDPVVIGSILEQLVPRADRMEVGFFLNPEAENDCTDTLDDNRMVADVVEKVQGSSDNIDANQEGNKDLEVVKLPSIREQQRAVALTKLVAESLDCREVISDLCRLQRELRRQVLESYQQTIIDSFLAIGMTRLQYHTS